MPDVGFQSDDVEKMREERFRWDEENRLLAISQNGYVSQYWYDADGERVVKEHGANQAVFVNSDEDGTVTQTDRYSVYPNGYYSYGDDGRYTKHIYIGAERIASQVGGKPYPSPNTESVSVAGRSNGIDIRVDYSGKLDQHLAQIDSVYDAFDLPYNGTNHDSYYDNYFFDRPGYWDNTEGMTLNGGEPETPRGIQDRDLLYYYHRDHLGSSTAVSNDDGKLSQQVEYLPYGEVFLEKQMASCDYHSPFRFNGKELDEEAGLYYYGARYMNPRLSIWYGTDLMQEEFPYSSSYVLLLNQPCNYIDEKGNQPESYDGNYYDNPLWYRQLGLGPDQIWNRAVNGLDNITMTFIGWVAPDAYYANLIRKAVPNELKNDFLSIDDHLLASSFKVVFVDREPTIVPAQSIWQDVIDIGFSILDVAAVISPSGSTGVLAKTNPVSCTAISQIFRGAKTMLKKAHLPTEGKIRFVPRPSDVKAGRLTVKQKGYVDKFGNIWTKGPSRTKGEPFEWDVQLSKKGREQLWRFSKDGSHLNVSLKGRITH